MSVTDIGRESAQASQGNQTTEDDYERHDVSGLEYIKTHPTTAVGGTARVLRYFPGDPDQEGLDRGFAGLIVDDPFSVDDDNIDHQVVVENDNDTGDDYKLVNLGDRNTKVLTPDGPQHWVEDDPDIELEDAMGIDFGGNSFYGTIREDFDVDQAVIKLTGSAGRAATSVLDVNGGTTADVVRTDNGAPKVDPDSGFPTYNGGLLERWNGDDDDWEPPRFARDTQLRPDVEGQQVSFLVQRQDEVMDDYDGDGYWSTVTVREDEDDEWGNLTPTEEFEADANLERATKWLEYSYPSREEIAQLRAEQGISVDDDLADEFDVTVEAEAE